MAVFIVVAFAVPFLVNVNRFRPQIESGLSAVLGRSVMVGNLSISVFSGGVGADQLSITDDPKFSSTPFVTAKSLHVGIEMMPLLFRKEVRVYKIVVDRPEINLLRDRDGMWNFSSLGSHSAQDKISQQKSAPPENMNFPNAGLNDVLNIQKLDLNDGTVSMGSTSGKRKPLVYDNVNVGIRDFSVTRAFPVLVSARLPGGGSLKIDGTAGPLHAADVTLTPLRADVKLSRLDLSQSALVDPDLGIGGSADFEGAVRSDGLTAKARGTIRTKSLRLVAKGSPAAVPVEAVIAIEHDLQSQTGKILQADVTIGKALARLTGTYDMHGEATSIHTTLNGLAMPVDDLEAMLPAAGVTLPTGSRLKGGNISLQVDSTGPLNALVSTGWVRMSNSALAGFNLNSRISALSALTGRQTGSDTTIESLSSDLRHTSDGTRLDRINMLIPALGTITGSGTISSSDALDFKMVAKLSGTGVGFTKVAGLVSGGIPVSIGGTTSNPTFNPDMKALVNGTLKGLTDGKENPLSGLKAIFGKKNP